ncbi:tyrosyl-DNA phosphodiesterase-domain-containing protein [Leptodontidium sp. 2 PMI_412]|nr:tyrosyl-DNA phosphodiesterase-domain-containing protein [Leptodontidium sp. 2 PMI_412]
MSGSESDEDLKRAIALSLQERSPRLGSQSNVINLVSDSDDDDDDDLDAPVTTRKISPRDQAREVVPTEASGTTTPKPRSQPSVGILGLDRKAMEEERLKRQKQREGGGLPMLNSKRHASVSPPRLREQEKAGAKSKSKTLDFDVHSGSQPHEDKRQKIAHVASDVLSRNQLELLNGPGIRYPDGVVRKTWVKGTPRLGDDIKIEEVLQKDDLKLAVLSTFQVEPEWVESKLDPKTKVIWVLQAKTDAEKDNIRSNAPNNYRFCFPSMEGNINCMHSKLQLLSYSTHLRVVIPSANLTPYDWGETGIMENVCFLIDLPRLPTGQAATELTPFAEELLFFADALGLDQGTLKSLKKFDFSRTVQMAFVHSIGGSHLDREAWKRTGYCGLATAVQNLGLETEEAIDIDFLASSIGSLNETFLKSLYLAAKGDDGLVEYGWRTGKSSRNKGMCETERKLSDTLNDRFRIYFPTAETVAKSHGGIGCGSTICLQPSWYDSETFPRHLMRDSKSLRPGMLMHSKMMFVRGKANKGNSKIAWAYVGSANLSESAWGRLVKDKSTKEPKLTLKNWECGVVVRVPATIPSAHEAIPGREDGEEETLGMDVFAGHVPVPMQMPGDQYGLHRPWFFKDH